MKPTDTATSKLFIGIDMHKRSWRIQTATDLFQGTGLTTPLEPDFLKKGVDQHFPGYQAGMVA